MRELILGTFTVLWLVLPAIADDPVFSGPQVGEKLPAFAVEGVLGEQAGKQLELAGPEAEALALIFVHARTRPAFGLSNLVMNYAGSLQQSGLKPGVVFLTDDPTATADWMRRVQRYFPQKVPHGISKDGLDGPGAYGLNRNVTLTILVGKKGVVTANFALVQPSMQSDGPKILNAIAKAAGQEKAPSIEELSRGTRRGGDRRMRASDPKLAGMLRSLLRTEPDQVRKAAADIEKYVAENEAARKQLAQTANTIVRSGRIANYGNKEVQKVIQEWARKYPIPERKERR